MREGRHRGAGAYVSSFMHVRAHRGVAVSWGVALILLAVPSTASASDDQLTYFVGWQELSLGNVQAPLRQAGYSSLSSSSLVQGVAYENAIASKVVLGVAAGVFGYGWFGTSLGRTGAADGPVSGSTELQATYRGYWGSLELGADLIGYDGILLDNSESTSIPNVWPVVTLGVSEFDLKLSQVTDFQTALTSFAGSLTMSSTSFQIGVAVPTMWHLGRRSGIAIGLRPALFYSTPADWTYSGASGVVTAAGGPGGGIFGGYIALSVGRW
jgi:hypothetical protein